MEICVQKITLVLPLVADLRKLLYNQIDKDVWFQHKQYKHICLCHIRITNRHKKTQTNTHIQKEKNTYMQKITLVLPLVADLRKLLYNQIDKDVWFQHKQYKHICLCHIRITNRQKKTQTNTNIQKEKNTYMQKIALVLP